MSPLGTPQLFIAEYFVLNSKKVPMENGVQPLLVISSVSLPMNKTITTTTNKSTLTNFRLVVRFQIIQVHLEKDGKSITNGIPLLMILESNQQISKTVKSILLTLKDWVETFMWTVYLDNDLNKLALNLDKLIIAPLYFDPK